MATATATPQLSDKQLQKMLSLMRDADSVELKLTIPTSTSARRSCRSAWTRWTARSG